MIRISRLGWCAIVLVLLAPWAVLIWLHRTPDVALPAPKQSAGLTSDASASGDGLRTGPWGKLESLQIAIEPPEEFIPADYSPAPIRWVFKQTSPAALAALWEAAGLPPEQRAGLENIRRRQVSGDTIVIEPENDLVLALTPAARARIYAALAVFPENGPQREPFRFRGEAIDDWFVGSGLPDDIVALTKNLIYRRNGTAFFSDYDLVVQRISDARLRTLYLKTLSRKTALLLTVRIDRDTDVDALANYWGRGRRAKDVKPLLQSLVRQPHPSALDIVHLIPRFARSLLYTFPLPSDDPASANRDCHWTSFNFYRDEPDERFTDIDFVKQTLLNDYFPVAGAPQLGDVLMFVQTGGIVLHSCVYVADDIVFTKNGPSFAVPWQFARLDSVLSFYSVGDEPLEVRRYRSKHH